MLTCSRFGSTSAGASRFSRDAHRPLRSADDLSRILAIRGLRTLSKKLTPQYNNAVDQIPRSRPSYALCHAQVEVRERPDGTLTILQRQADGSQRVS
jgi:hypothetical protein